MDEAQRARMEGEAVYWRFVGAIAAVADNRMAGILEMYAYLVFAACGKVQFQKGVGSAVADGAIAGYGQLTLFGSLR